MMTVRTITVTHLDSEDEGFLLQFRRTSLQKTLAAVAVCLAASGAGVVPRALAQPADEPAVSLGSLTLDQLLTQLRGVGGGSPRDERITKEIASRGGAVYDELLKHFNARDEFYTASTAALLAFPKFGDVLLTWSGPAMNPPPLQLLDRMQANAVPALLRFLALPEEAKRAAALQHLLAVGRHSPDEADRLFTPILTATGDVKPRLIAAQGLVTGLWTKDAQEAALQELAHGDAAMSAALLAAIGAKALPLDQAGAAWVKALQGATDPAAVGNLLQASAALRVEDLPAAVPVLLAVLKNLKPDADARISGAIPVVIGTLKRGGKATIAALPELLRVASAPARDAAIGLCTQMGADASPVAANLATPLEAADCPVERKAALLGALAAMGPAARVAIPTVQKISDPALDKQKKHALLMLQDGWTPTVIAEWKPTRMRRVHFTPRPSAEADMAVAADAIDALRGELEQNANITPPGVRGTQIDELFALAGDVDSACQASTVRTGGFSALTQVDVYKYAVVANLRAGKRDAATDALNRAIGRYRLALMTDPAVALSTDPTVVEARDFADVAIAQVQTGDIDAMLKLAQSVPVDIARLVRWQAAHQDPDGALETAMAVPYGPERIGALDAAGVAFGNAGRAQEAARAYTLALDAAHAITPADEALVARLAVAVAGYSDTGLTAAMLRGFYNADDRDVSAQARAAAIDRLISRGLVDSAVQLAIAAPPDPTADGAERLNRLGSFLHAPLALGNGARRADVAAFCDKVHKELDAIYDAGEKRPGGRDVNFAMQYFSTAAFLAQVYINAGSTRDGGKFLDSSAARLQDLKATLGGQFESLAGTVVHLEAEVGNTAVAQGLAEKMAAGTDALNAWCAIAEAQFPRDGAAANRSWAQAQAAGAGTTANAAGAAPNPGNAAQATAVTNNSRARANAGMALDPVVRIMVQPRGAGQPVPNVTPPVGPQGKQVEDAARAVVDPAARITMLQGLAQQYMQLNPQPNPQTQPVLVEHRLPPEYATLMREAEAKLAGNTAEIQALRAQAFGVCILAGQIDALEARVQVFSTAVQNGPAAGAKAAATAPAPTINNINPLVLKALAVGQGATGHAIDANKWIETLTDPGLRAQVRFALIRGLVLRISDILVAAQDGS
jgi:hypothetical protein